MQQTDKKQFAYCMAAMGEAFSQEATPLKVDIYFKALMDLSIDDIEKAVWSLINSRRTATFPKVAEIREAVFGNPEDRAQIALSKLERALNSCRGSQSVKFDDPVIHMAVTRMGGWVELSDIIDRGEWKYRRAEFVRLYIASVASPCKYPEILKGSHAIENERNGYSPEQMAELGYSPRAVNAVHGAVLIGNSGVKQLNYEGKEQRMIESEA